MNLRHFARYWLPVLPWMLIIFVASTDMMSAEHTSRFIGPFLRWLNPDISSAAIAQVQLIVRKGAHMSEYAVLGWLLARAFLFGREDFRTRAALTSWLVAVVWAGLDEYHQTFVASRTGSPVDVMIDATGALVGLGLYLLFARWTRGAAPIDEGLKKEWA